MRRSHFVRLVQEALETIPVELADQFSNLEIVVRDAPTDEELSAVGLPPEETLLGLYEGVPLTERGGTYDMVLPDRIVLFQRPIEQICEDDDEIRWQVRETVVHEVAHHFGIDDEGLLNLGRA
ncbi:MAG: metallopeptidase family protein [Anaerolineae bacterium]